MNETIACNNDSDKFRKLTNLSVMVVGFIGNQLRSYGIDTEKLQPGRMVDTATNLKEESVNFAINVIKELFDRNILSTHEFAYQMLLFEQIDHGLDGYLLKRLDGFKNVTWTELLESSDLQMDLLMCGSAELILKAVSSYTVYWGYSHLDFLTASKVAFVLRTFCRFENLFQAGYALYRKKQELKLISNSEDRERYEKHMRRTFIFALTPLGIFSGLLTTMHKYDPESFKAINNISDYWRYVEKISKVHEKKYYSIMKPIFMSCANKTLGNYLYFMNNVNAYKNFIMSSFSNIIPK